MMIASTAKISNIFSADTAKIYARQASVSASAGFVSLLSLSRLQHHPQQFLLDLFQAKLSCFAGCAVHPLLTFAVRRVRIVHSLQLTDFLRQEGNPFRDVPIVHAEIITPGAALYERNVEVVAARSSISGSLRVLFRFRTR